MSLSSAESLLSELRSKYEAGDAIGGNETLSKLKIALIEADAAGADANAKDARRISIQGLELGVLLSVTDGDLDGFSRNISQLKPLYEQAQASDPSGVDAERKCHMLGLNLMRLLVDHRLSEFHAELELLTDKEASHALVSFPINIERQLMVGMYDKVLEVAVPDSSFQFFVDQLLPTVRDSIGDCLEVSYQEMDLDDARRMMKFDKAQELLDYIEECRDDWVISGDAPDQKLCFQPPPSGVDASTDVPSMELIAQSLTYATELERIV